MDCDITEFGLVWCRRTVPLCTAVRHKTINGSSPPQPVVNPIPEYKARAPCVRMRIRSVYVCVSMSVYVLPNPSVPMYPQRWVKWAALFLIRSESDSPGSTHTGAHRSLSSPPPLPRACASLPNRKETRDTVYAPCMSGPCLLWGITRPLSMQNMPDTKHKCITSCTKQVPYSKE